MLIALLGVDCVFGDRVREYYPHVFADRKFAEAEVEFLARSNAKSAFLRGAATNTHADTDSDPHPDPDSGTYLAPTHAHVSCSPMQRKRLTTVSFRRRNRVSVLSDSARERERERERCERNEFVGCLTATVVELHRDGSCDVQFSRADLLQEGVVESALQLMHSSASEVS